MKHLKSCGSNSTMLSSYSSVQKNFQPTTLFTFSISKVWRTFSFMAFGFQELRNDTKNHAVIFPQLQRTPEAMLNMYLATWPMLICSTRSNVKHVFSQTISHPQGKWLSACWTFPGRHPMHRLGSISHLANANLFHAAPVQLNHSGF